MTHVGCDDNCQAGVIALHSRARYPSNYDAIADAMAQISGFAEHVGLLTEDQLKLQLVVEELMTNTIRHGGVKPEDMIEIGFARNAETIAILYSDSGIEFDPVAYQLPEPGASTAGYGWVLIRGLCRAMHYSRQAQANVLNLDLPVNGMKAA